MARKLELTTEELKDIKELANDLITYSREVNALEYAFRCKNSFNRFPLRIQRKIFEMKSRGYPYIVISNLLTDPDIPVTPLKKTSLSQAPEYYQTLLLIFSMALGYFYKFKSKNHEGFVEDIFPIQEHADKQLGTNSAFLEWHVEDIVHSAKPDYVGLFCLRGNEHAKTLLFEGRDYYSSTTYNNRLSDAKFKVYADETFNKKFQKSSMISVFEECDDPEFNYDPFFMITEDNGDREALNRLQNFIDRNYLEIVLQPGEILLFDNRRVAHSRTNYTPKFDGSDRWLLRSVIVESTWKLRYSKTEQELTVQ